MGGTGFALSFALSRGVSAGTADAGDSASGWGILLGLGFDGLLENGLGAGAPTVALSFDALGTLFGVVVIALAVGPSAGQVSMANSGGIWLAGIASAFLESLSPSAPGSLRWGIADLGAVFGLGAGAVFAHFHPVGRFRMLLVDFGGAIGMLAGLGAGAALGYTFSPTRRSLYGAMIGATTAAGLVGAWVASGRLEEDGSAPAVAL